MTQRLSHLLDAARRAATPLRVPREMLTGDAGGEDCPHRGGEIRQQVADLCGLRGQSFPVHSCSLHGECTDRRICQRQTVRTCFLCRLNGEDQPAET